VARVVHLLKKVVNATELRGLWEGLCWIKADLPEQRVWVEGDSLNVVKALIEENGDRGRCLVNNGKNLARQASTGSISHIFREANKAAD